MHGPVPPTTGTPAGPEHTQARARLRQVLTGAVVLVTAGVVTVLLLAAGHVIRL